MFFEIINIAQVKDAVSGTSVRSNVVTVEIVALARRNDFIFKLNLSVLSVVEVNSDKQHESPSNKVTWSS